MNALIAGCGKKLYHVKGQGDAEDRDDEGDPIVVERTEGLQTSFQGNVQRGEVHAKESGHFRRHQCGLQLGGKDLEYSIGFSNA